MTEAEWLACLDPDVMADSLGRKATNRKLRLFGIACCRRIIHLMADERSRKAVAVSESFADGHASHNELSAAAASQSLP